MLNKHDPATDRRTFVRSLISALRHFKHYALNEKVQYHYLALQTLLLRTSGRTTTLLLRNTGNQILNFMHHLKTR